MATQFATVQISVIDCPQCGIAFGVTPAFEQRRRDSHAAFYCPEGHSMSYGAESQAERLKRELQAERDKVARERSWRDQADERARQARLAKEHVERRLSATRGVVTRTKRKVADGRCPCCSHQFKNLRTHMRNEHPNYDPIAGAEAIAAKSDSALILKARKA